MENFLSDSELEHEWLPILELAYAEESSDEKEVTQKVYAGEYVTISYSSTHKDLAVRAVTGDLQPVAPLWRWADEDAFLASAFAASTTTQSTLDLAQDASGTVEMVRGSTNYLPFVIQYASDESSADIAALREKCLLSGVPVTNEIVDIIGYIQPHINDLVPN